MAKPAVSISAPRRLFVGQRAVIEVDVTVEKDTKVDYIDAEITGEQGWSVGGGNSKVSARAKHPELTKRLLATGVLPAATTTRFTTSFMLPPGTAPTHAMAPAYARLRLRIHISIPWRIDGRYYYEFPVRMSPPAHVERTPHAVRSTPLTTAANKPRIELGLASTRLIAGEVLVGTCALFHFDDRAPREVELSLVPMMTLHGRGRNRERRAQAISRTLTLPAGSAGTGVPFDLPLPVTMIPTFETVTHSLSWWLVARSGSFFGGRVEVAVPLEVLDASAAETTAKLTAAPRVGDEQIATLFATFAARNGWHGGDTAPDDERLAGQFSIERDVGESQIHLAYSYRGEDGTYLVARIDHLSLGLGLSVTPSSSLRHVFFKDVEVDIAAWDRAHHVVARWAEQAIPFLRAVVPEQMQSGHLGSLVRWSDSDLVFERPVSGVDDEQLATMGAELEALARAIAAAQPSITPPPNITTDLKAWQVLARTLGGRLTVGDLSVEGKLDGLQVDLGVTWDDVQRPLSVHASVGDPEVASAALRRVVISLPRPALDVMGDPAADQLVDQVTRWPNDLTDLRVIDGVASASYVVPPGDPAVIEVARVRELVEALRAVLVALDPRAGPYR